MQLRLSARRRIPAEPDWRQVERLLGTSTLTLDALASATASSSTSLPPAPAGPRMRYEINKGAFQRAQAHRAGLIERTMRKMDRSEDAIRSAPDPRRPRDRARCPPDHRVRDRHVVEHVVAARNELYHEASAYVAQGAIPDLQSMRKLPLDTEFHPRDSPRTFYWGYDGR
jgi:hypothetical protein